MSDLNLQLLTKFNELINTSSLIIPAPSNLKKGSTFSYKGTTYTATQDVDKNTNLLLIEGQAIPEKIKNDNVLSRRVVLDRKTRPETRRIRPKPSPVLALYSFIAPNSDTVTYYICNSFKCEILATYSTIIPRLSFKNRVDFISAAVDDSTVITGLDLSASDIGTLNTVFNESTTDRTAIMHGAPVPPGILWTDSTLTANLNSTTYEVSNGSLVGSSGTVLLNEPPFLNGTQVALAAQRYNSFGVFENDSPATFLNAGAIIDYDGTFNLYRQGFSFAYNAVTVAGSFVVAGEANGSHSADIFGVRFLPRGFLSKAKDKAFCYIKYLNNNGEQAFDYYTIDTNLASSKQSFSFEDENIVLDSDDWRGTTLNFIKSNPDPSVVNQAGAAVVDRFLNLGSNGFFWDLINNLPGRDRDFARNTLINTPGTTVTFSFRNLGTGQVKQAKVKRPNIDISYASTQYQARDFLFQSLVYFD